MSLNIFKTIQDAFSRLNPHDVRMEAERQARVGLFAQSETGFQQMEAFFAPATLSGGRRVEVASFLQRAHSGAPNSGQYEIEIYGEGMAKPPNGFTFYLNNPERTVNEILAARPELSVALARQIFPFRDAVAQQWIKKVSKENAMFALATAIPDIIPFLSLPWAVGEFASDTAVLTANQVRLAFMLAAISNRDIGYMEQKAEVASILVGAFGWRALAREVVGKIPFGAGLVGKAAVAYAGTLVAGMSLEKYYRIGYGYTKQERDAAYQDALGPR